MIRPRKCPCCYRPLHALATLEDSLLRCDWDGLFHWDPRYRRLRHLSSRQAWNVDGIGNICPPYTPPPPAQAPPPRTVQLPKLP
ncbi:DUF2396 family protein [Anthocerotibacter panamensis]|uniref:DUF2396 family protein n=1 Tax=Anthocerotibacter panamensis TaxID=2857077 RepID=UPI001C4059D0|nr:DUF2396 family protein [Anthocerotibacter panamensis]